MSEMQCAICAQEMVSGGLAHEGWRALHHTACFLTKKTCGACGSTETPAVFVVAGDPPPRPPRSLTLPALLVVVGVLAGGALAGGETSKTPLGCAAPAVFVRARVTPTSDTPSTIEIVAEALSPDPAWKP